MESGVRDAVVALNDLDGFACDGDGYVRGAGTYVDDVQLAGQAHGFILRSPHAHARLRSVDVSRAREQPGVLCVVTGAELAGSLGPLPCMMPLPAPAGQPAIAADRVLLAADRVRHLGDGVAFVVAETPAQAVDAAHCIGVDYEPLPAVVDPLGPVTPGAAIWSTAPDNVCFDWHTGDAAAVAAALDGAAHVARLRLRNPRIVVNAIEPRAAIGCYDAAAGRYTLIANTQGGHFVGRVSARALGIPPSHVRVLTPNVGGGFGSKIFAYPEQALVLWAARALGRPVKWCASRREAFLSDTQGRDHVTDAALALDPDGRFLAFSVDTTVRLGAYLSQYTPFVATACGASVQAGAYRLGAVSVRVRGVFTNTVPLDAYRGSGRPEATYVLERVIDHAARQIGMDHAELRARNLLEPTRSAVTMVTGLEVDGGQFLDNQRRCLAQADYAGFPARRAESACRGRLRGFGFANYLEANGGLATARIMDETLPQESASVRFLANGHVHVVVGTQSTGQDHARPVVELLARGLGLDPAAVTVGEGDTAALPVSGGTGGSKSLLTSSAAAEQAVHDVIAKGRARLAARWTLPLDAVTFDEGVFRVGSRAFTCTVLELAASEPGALDVHSTATLQQGSSANGCHAAEVEIDPETGQALLVAYTAVDDFGVVVNPGAVDGQVHGGLAQGLGQALFEEGVYDVATGRLAADSLSTYALPRAVHLPWISRIDNGLACSTNALGAKACAEASVSAAPPTIMNAVVDALAAFPGVERLQMPARPEAILRIIRTPSPGGHRETAGGPSA